jgi:hypothetical protein
VIMTTSFGFGGAAADWVAIESAAQADNNIADANATAGNGANNLSLLMALLPP